RQACDRAATASPATYRRGAPMRQLAQPPHPATYNPTDGERPDGGPDYKAAALRRARAAALHRAGLQVRRGADVRLHERGGAEAHARDGRAAALEPLAAG